MATRKKPIKLDFWVDEHDLELINQRMEDTGYTNRSEYIRDRLIDVHLIVVDMEELNELRTEVNKIGVNINQLIRKYHYDGNLKDIDINLLQDYMKQLTDFVNDKYTKVENLYKLAKAKR